MKKIITILVLLISGAIQSQTFDFACEPDCNREVSIQEGLVLNIPNSVLQGNAIIGVTTQLGDLVEARLDGQVIPDGAAITGLRVENGGAIGAAVNLPAGATIAYSCENGFVLNDELSFAEIPTDADPLTDCDLPDITVHIVEGAMFAFPPSQFHLTGLSYNNVPIKGIYYAPTPSSRRRAHNGETFPRDAQIVGYIVEVDGEEISLSSTDRVPLNIGITCSAVIVDGSNDNVSGDLHPLNVPCNRTISIQAGLTYEHNQKTWELIELWSLNDINNEITHYANTEEIPEGITISGVRSIPQGSGLDRTNRLASSYHTFLFLGFDTPEISCEDGFVLNDELPWASGPSNDIDISNISRPSRFSELTSITVPGGPDNQYHYVWQPYLAFQSNNNGWRVRRNEANVITGIKLGFNEPSFVEITGGTQNQIIQAALHAMAHRGGDDDAEVVNGVTYSNNYRLAILGVSEFDTGRGERFYATETTIFTKANGGHSNRSVVDLTPLSVIDGFNTRNDFTTTSRSSLLVTRGQAIAGEWYAIKTSDRTEIVEIVNVTQDSSGKDFAIFDGSDLTASIPSGTAVSVWQITDPTGFGIVRVNSRAPTAISARWNSYYDLRGFNWSGAVQFDGQNGSGGAFYDHVEEDANSGSVAGRRYRYSVQQAGINAYGSESGNLVIMRSYVYPQGWGLYISGASGSYYSLWYSHDLRHQWQVGINNDFEAKRYGTRLDNARFIN